MLITAFFVEMYILYKNSLYYYDYILKHFCTVIFSNWFVSISRIVDITTIDITSNPNAYPDMAE